MTESYVAFDLEIAKVFLEDNPQLDPAEGLGISCAATLTREGELRTWHSAQMADKMTLQEAQALVAYLEEQQSRGIPVVTWNGLKFDFHVLAVESGQQHRCERIAWEHVDLMLAVHCIKGYPLGLAAAAKACGAQKGVEGLTHGRYAPYYWQQGNHQLALDYVSQDVRATARVAEVVMQQWGFVWTSKRNNPVRFFVPKHMRPSSFAGLTPRFVREWPLPDTGWMSDPIPREDFWKWLRSS